MTVLLKLLFYDGLQKGDNMAWKCPECGFLQHLSYRCKNCGEKCAVILTAEKMKEMRRYKKPESYWKRKKK